MAGIKFPFQRGTLSFPSTNDGKLDEITDGVRSLLNTGKFEIPFGGNMGVNLYATLFSNMTEIDKALLAQSIRNAIITNEPRMNVLSVDVVKVNNIVNIEIFFEVAGTTGTMDVQYSAETP